nr:hypothetical protein [Tanacetum cinerariifolium]
MEEDAEDKAMEIPAVEQLLDEVDKQNKAVQETLESPYDTEFKIKVVKSYFTSQISKLQDQIMHDSDELADYESILEDDLRSVLGFETADFDDTQRNYVSRSDHTFPYHNASAKRLSLPGHLDHICEEVRSLHSNLGTMNSSIIHQVSDGIKSTLPALSDRFACLETQFSKILKSDMGKSVTSLVKSGMKEVKDNTNSQANSLGNFCLDAHSMQTQLNDIQSLLESAVLIDDTAEGEKNSKAIDTKPVATQGAPPASDDKLNEGTKLVVHNSEEMKSKGIISVDNDSYEDDKQPLSQRFKIMTHIPDIPNLIPLSNFVLEHLTNFLKAKRLGLSPSSKLATFRLSAKEKKRKRTELIKEVFVTKYIKINGMDMNFIPPPGVMPIQGLVINEPELGVGEPPSAGLRGKEDQLSAKHQLAVKGLSECKPQRATSNVFNSKTLSRKSKIT